MALLRRKKKTAAKSKASAKKSSSAKTTKKKTGQSAEAQAVLAKMKAKSDAGDCAFC